MTTMFVLISHPLTETQRRDAALRFGVTRFDFLDTEVWSQIPADAESVLPWIREPMRELRERGGPGDVLFVQGDFGATFAMVQFAYRLGLTPVYATTERKAVERREGDRIVTTRVFDHVRFRVYERIGEWQ